jgi:hypothetical protein
MNKIYILKDPITLEIKYVGQTSLTLYRRLTRHVSESLNRVKDTPKTKWIKELIQKELCPIIELIEITEEPNKRESYYLNKYKNTILNNELDSNYSKPNSKSVYCLCLEPGKILKFNTAKEASSITETPQYNLVSAIHGKKVSNGFMWSYNLNFKNVKYNCFPKWVILTNINTKEKLLFRTKIEAIEHTKGNYKSHKNGADYALEHENKEYRGYYWEYVRERVKFDELLESCNANQQPSSSNSENKVEEKVQRLTVEDSETNKTDTSVEQLNNKLMI